MSTFSVLTICLTALSTAASLPAKNFVITLDPTKTKVDFTLSATLHAVHGTFRLQSGHVAFDQSAHIITGDIVVEAASGDSDDAIRDRRMRREVLQVRRYPEIRFNPIAFSGPVAMNGVSRIEVTGLLTIHGQAHRITFPIKVQMSDKKVTATGRFILPYVRWGMKPPSVFFLKVSKSVQIDITAVGQVRQADAK
ncbi:MAG: YceI family protein [Bryobacteraceae bacterium]